MTALVGYNVFFKAISEVRKGIDYVKEIDLALTELKKVTDETEASYKKFLKTAAGTASEIGSTVSDFTEATANFARLGYTMTESANMAKTAVVYKNVADGLDTVEDATDSIISTMKAFGIESNNTMGIVDRFNEVGNNFAITSAGIGDALQRSASALFAAGNTIDESIALVTAANSVIQNPEQVGTALKTLSLRIRGVKTELEEAGLETEGMAKTTAQLQAKLKALTHGKVDIMLDADTFKNTTQILREMSEAWQDMTDMERAAALELIGGKRQANILSSVITNFETVEEVIETSMDSSGSAMAENAKWLDSIEGKTTQLTNAMQALWNDAINSDKIKLFLDLALGATKLVDTIGLLPTALAGVIGYFAIFKKITPASLFNDLTTNVRNYYAAMRQVSDIKSLNLGVDNNGMLGVENIKAYSQALAGLSEKQQAAILTSAGLEKAHIAQVLAQQGVEDATIRQLVGQEALNTAKQAAVAMTGAEIQATLAKQGVTLSDVTATWLADNATKELTKDEVLKASAMLMSKGATDQEIIALLGLAGASNTASISIKGVGKALLTMMASNPIGWIMMLVSGFSILISKTKQAKEEIAKSAKESVDAYKDVQKTLKDSKTAISEISGDYKKLASGVDELGNNISLSTSEYERYNEIVNQIADMFPTMVKGYTEEGNAIIKNKGSVEELTKAYEELREQANAELLLSGGNILKNYNNTANGSKWDNFWGFTDSEKIKAAKELERIFNNKDTFDFKIFSNSDRDAVYEDIVTLLKDAGIETDPLQEFTHDYVERAVTEFPSIVQGIINSWDATVNAAASQVKPLVNAYLDTSIGYAGLTSEQKSMIDAIVSDFGAEFFNQFNGDVSAMYIAIEEIIANIKQANIDDVFNATLDIQTRFNNGELTYDEYIAQINAFIAILDDLQEKGILDAETVASLKVLFDFQPTTADNINKPLIESAKGLLDDEGDVNVGSVLTKTDLEIVDRYKEEWKELEGTEITLERLLELIKEIKESTEDYNISDAIGDLDVIQESFGKLGDAFDEFRDNGIVTAETLAEIQEVFGSFDGFDKYAAVLGNSSSSMDDVKSALSGLATAYLENHEILSNLTEENEAFITSQLEAFGVINAEEYVAGMKAIHEAIKDKAEAYNIDLSNYATVEAMKTAIANDFGIDITNINGDTINELADAYDIDLSNFTNVELAKTAVAIEQAKIRALADKQKAISNVQSSAKAKRDSQTFEDIKPSNVNASMQAELAGKTFAEIRDAYFNNEYDNKAWAGDVKNLLFTGARAYEQELTKATIDETKAYNERIAELNAAYDLVKSLDDAVVDYYTPLRVDASKLGGPDTSSSKSGSDSANEFKETLDWIEIRLEEINEQIDLMNAALENASSYAEKNNIIDSMIGVNKTKMANLTAGIQKYAEYAASLLLNIPAQYRDAARDGAIAISEFVGEADEQTVEAIEKYREWAQKVADLKQELEGVKTELRDLAIQKIDNIQDYGGAKTGIEDNQTEKLQNRVDLDETSGLITSSEYYKAMMENSGKKIEYWKPLLADMQKEFDKAVQSGSIQRGSVEWYEQLAKLYEVQAEIDAATIELEEFQNAINDIYWDNFDQLINRLGYLKDETQSLIDLMDSEDMVITPETDDGWNSDQVEWTKEGLASLGLYAQQMEIAEYQSKQYAEAIDDLSKDYKDGLYSENEYIEKLEELKSAQYDSIEAYYDAQDAIVELNEARIDSIKEGIEKEIDAYEELIEKQKEQLDAEKDLYDFQKNTTEQQKNISQIERQLAALANDHSLSAAAKRKKLEAELAEAQYELQDTYYNRSVEDKQTALDKELEDFQTEKDAEILKWEEYLANVEQIVSDSLNIVQENAAGIGATLTEKAEEYNLTISDAILTPWQDGSLAVSDYQTTFDTAMSSTMNQLEALKNKWQEVIDKMAEVGKVNVTAINKENANYAAATKPEPAKTQAQKDPPKTNNKETNATNIKSDQDYYGVALAIWHGDYGWGNGSTRNKNLTSKGFDANKVQEIVNKIGKDGYIHNGTWRGKYYGIKDLAPYHINKFAKGTNSAKKDQWAIIDELGDELQLVPGKNGRLEYVKKGTGIVPADLTKRLVDMAMDPQNMLDENRPAISAPHIINNEINIDCSVGTMVNIEHCDQSTLPDVEKLVNKAFDKHMQTLNNAIRSKVR
jgi:TP901 family phage tail tape measure protein